MVERLTPSESDQVRCAPDMVDGDQIELEGLKADLNKFIIYRSRFDRAQMIYLAGRIMHRVTNFFSPFLCDIGIMMHHEGLSDEDYEDLLIQIQQAQGDTDGDTNGDTNTNAG